MALCIITLSSNVPKEKKILNTHYIKASCIDIVSLNAIFFQTDFYGMSHSSCLFMAKQSVSVHGLEKAVVDAVLSSHVHVNVPAPLLPG